MTIYIKNMVCGRCKRAVRELLEGLGFSVTRVDLGEVDVLNWPSSITADDLRRVLQANEFDVLDDPKKVLIEQLKTLIINEVFHEKGEKPAHQNFSDYLAQKTGHEYPQLSALFSSVQGLTIEKYIIAQKIERVKELLTYGELSVSEIAFRLGYSSVQHLSNQFKQVTGQTPGAFRQERGRTQRRDLDKVVP
ncbi:MAG: helix-turn-helix domain-containing protein [Bacteroidetes bacterium]|nr:helix-turn-helix domain-containing protein [Fibrella sp.]